MTSFQTACRDVIQDITLNISAENCFKSIRWRVNNSKLVCLAEIGANVSLETTQKQTVLEIFTKNTKAVIALKFEKNGF